MKIPKYARIPLAMCLLVNCGVYYITKILCLGRFHYDFTTSFDRFVPLLPCFVLIYIGCYLFWVINYCIIACQSKEQCYRFVLCEITAKLLCGVIFIILPTTNIRPQLTGNSICEQLLAFIYQMDSPVNLFPSIHCLVSWFCYIGLRKQKGVSKGYRWFSLVMAILICISTQVTKQHYIVDVISAILLAEGCYYLAFHTCYYDWVKQWYHRIFTYKHETA